MRQAALLSLLHLAVFSLSAQTTSTEILGLVADASGALVPGARITITHVATNESRTALTNMAGEYSFPAVDIGDFTVRCEAQGFKTQNVRGVRVQTQEKVRLNFALEVGAVTETVDVQASVALLKTEEATLGQVIENKRIIELPLNGRNISNLAVLAPGVQFGVRSGMADGSGGDIPGAAVAVIANGIRETYGTVALDGVDARNPRDHIAQFAPSVEAVEEFKVQTGSYSAEYGQGGGAIVQVTMKSGTNDLKGTAFEFLRNEKLDAENYFLNFERPAGSGRLPKDRLRRNQFGAVVSGPVKLPGYDGRNRTFWAFDYEGRRQTVEGVQTAFFPPETFRQGDFSALLTPAINPATNRPFRAAIMIFDPLNGEFFPNNRIPASRIHAGARNLMQFLPPPQFQQADIVDFTARASVPSTIGQDQYFWRIDHNFTQSDKVFVRYATSRSDLHSDYVNPNFPTDLTTSITNIGSQWLHTFNQNMLNELRFGVNLTESDLVNPRTDTNFDVDSLGIGKFRAIGDRKLTAREAGVPVISQFTIGDRDLGAAWDTMYSYQLSDNVSLHRDRHNFKMGAEYKRVSNELGTSNFPRGNMTFSANESGYDFASFLMGYPSAVHSPEGLPPSRPMANRFSFYVLDDWKVTKRLTLNLGLRWDYLGNPVDSFGTWRSVSIENIYTAPDGRRMPTILPVEIGEKGAVKLWEQQYRFFMPRIGIAFRPTDKWVVRSGGGWYASAEHLNTFIPLSRMPPYAGSSDFNSVTDAAAGGARRFRPGAPIVSFNDPFGGQALVRPQNLLRVPPNEDCGCSTATESPRITACRHRSRSATRTASFWGSPTR